MQQQETCQLKVSEKLLETKEGCQSLISTILKRLNPKLVEDLLNLENIPDEERRKKAKELTGQLLSMAGTMPLTKGQVLSIKAGILWIYNMACSEDDEELEKLISSVDAMLELFVTCYDLAKLLKLFIFELSPIRESLFMYQSKFEGFLGLLDYYIKSQESKKNKDGLGPVSDSKKLVK